MVDDARGTLSTGVPESDAPPAEPIRAENRRERVQRRTHQARLYTSLALAVAAGVILIALIAANTRRVKLSWVVGDTHASLVWIVLASAVLGWVLGNATSFLIRRRVRRRADRVLAVREDRRGH